ncbi:MAG: Acetolactate synthase isozyme 1 large subunit [Syntrophorhabdus sp. PtaB.Bin047]|nr:MAG: Acetolactate synthase isozyme 1 large subunit [Syntrophorhabdus sp. PtaB.Bin047]
MNGIRPAEFCDALKARGISFFTGVPDSLLQNLCTYLTEHRGPDEHIIAANEGNAVAMAAGHYLATGKVGAVYMENSGLGNTVNPLASLTDREVYRIPVLLIIGWRGEPGVKDEPQHVKQGRITTGQLELLEIPFRILEANSVLGAVLEDVFSDLEREKAPVAIVVRKDTFSNHESNRKVRQRTTFKREAALRMVLSLAGAKDIVIVTTGKTSREVFEIRAEGGEGQRDFLTVGSMGHTSSLALGAALGKPERRVICLDGDGSLLMHMGALPIIGSLKPKNLLHVLLNNASHESVGGQPTVADRIDFRNMALACGYAHYHKATDAASLSKCWQQLQNEKGPAMLEIVVSKGSRKDLGRPTATPEQNKRVFMEHIHG